ASANRLGALAGRLDTAGTSIVVDHHASNTRFGAVHLVDPGAAATSVVVEQLLGRLGVPLDEPIAECLYVALSTDTGSFKFDLACVLKQVAPTEWTVSLRSKGAVDVADVAVGLGGGGHRLAAGFTAHGALDEVVALIRAAL